MNMRHDYGDGQDVPAALAWVAIFIVIALAVTLMFVELGSGSAVTVPVTWGLVV